MTVLNDTALTPAPTKPAGKRPTGITRISVRPRAYTLEELRSEHCTAGSLFVAFEGRVFDVTEFVNDHPGGIEILLKFAGEDVTKVMKDASTHEHSSSAFNMLEAYCVGWIVGDGAQSDAEAIIQGKQLARDALQRRKANQSNGIKDDDDVTLTDDDDTGPFLDLDKPLIYQISQLDIGKEEYMRQVHRAQYLPHPVRMFESPFFEFLLRTPWYVVPVVWIPISTWLSLSSIHEMGLFPMAVWFGGGVLGWTLFEYVMHRFLFHADELLPDRPGMLATHFLLHGVHHFVPMDRLRLVFPPVLAILIAAPIYFALSYFMVQVHADATFGGLLAGYIIYDMTHYYLHHGRPHGEHLRVMKTYHLAHHYKNENLGYGVTSKLWDYIFGTVLRI